MAKKKDELKEKETTAKAKAKDKKEGKAKAPKEKKPAKAKKKGNLSYQNEDGEIVSLDEMKESFLKKGKAQGYLEQSEIYDTLSYLDLDDDSMELIDNPLVIEDLKILL